MSDVLSALPYEGGARVGWTPVAGSTEYEVRHSLTGAGSWTTVTGITTNYTILTGLDYLEVYDVQRRSVDGVDTSWSASVTVQPWIDPDDEFATLFREQGVTAATNYGDLGATYENDTWLAVLAVDRIRLGAFQSLLGINAQFGSADGLCGLIVRFSDTDVLQALVVTDASSSVTTGSGANTFGVGKHVVAVEKSGTTVTLYDEDGASIGSGTTTSATMDWTTSTTQRTTVNGHWATTVSPNLTGRNTGNVLDAAYIPGGVTSDQRTGLLRLFKEKYSTALPTQRVELFLDSENVDSNTVGAPSIIAPAKQGAVLTSVPGTRYDGLSFAIVRRMADGAWRMWATEAEYTASVLSDIGIGRFDSADGLAWNEPNLGHVGSTGLLIDGTSTNQTYLGAVIVTSGGNYQYAIAFDQAGNTIGGRYYSAADEDAQPSLLANIDPGLSYSELHAAVVRSDTRYLSIMNDGHTVDDRSVFNMITEDGAEAVGGTQILLGDVVALQAPDDENQFYDVKVAVLAPDLWLLFVSMFDATTDLTHVDLYVSRDEGLTASLIDTQWLPRGSSGQFDDSQIYGCSLERVGDDWRFYYVGDTQIHGSVEGSSIAYATLAYGRLAELVA